MIGSMLLVLAGLLFVLCGWIRLLHQKPTYISGERAVTARMQRKDDLFFRCIPESISHRPLSFACLENENESMVVRQAV